MHELPVDVDDHVAVSFVEFLQHAVEGVAATLSAANLFGMRLRTDASRPTGIHKAGRNIPGSGCEFRANASVPHRVASDMVRTMSILPLRRINSSPRFRRFLVIPVARSASTHENS